jgi:outer membrane protein TolC
MRPLIFLVALFYSVQSIAQNAPDLNNLSLAKAVDIGLQNAYSQRNAQTDIEIANQKVKETFGLGLPQLSGSAGLNNFLQLPVNLIPADAFVPGAPSDTYLRLVFGLKYSANAGVSLSQLIFSGEYLVGLQASRAFKSFSVLNKKKDEIEVKELVIKAYNTVLLLNETKRLLDRNINNIDSLVNQTDAYYKEGFLELQDVDRLKLTKSSLTINQANLTQQIKVAEQLLKFQMGVDVNSPISLSDSFNQMIIMAAQVKNDAGKFNFDESIDRMVLDQAVRLQELSVKRYKSQALPTLAGFYSYTQNFFGQEFRDLTDKNFSVPGGSILGLSLKVNIFTGLTRTAQINGAKLELKKTQTQYEQAQNGYALQSNNAQTEFNAAFEKYNNSQESVKLAERIYQTAQIKFKEGVSNSFELLQAQSDLLQAQANLIQSSSDLIVAKINFQKAQNKL